MVRFAEVPQWFSQIPVAVRVQSLFAGQMANAPVHAFAEVSTNDAAAAALLCSFHRLERRMLPESRKPPRKRSFTFRVFTSLNSTLNCFLGPKVLALNNDNLQ
eukprot:s854_g11.t1